MLAELAEQAYDPGWAVCTKHYRFPWPRGLTLWSTQDHVDWPIGMSFDGAHSDEMLYVQGLFELDRAPSPESLIGPGMREIERGQFRGRYGLGRWIELGYELGGAAWLQRRYFVPLDATRILLLTAQAEGARQAGVFGAAAAIAETVVSTGWPRPSSPSG